MKRISAESAAVDLYLEFQKPVNHFLLKFLSKLRICIQSVVIYPDKLFYTFINCISTSGKTSRIRFSMHINCSFPVLMFFNLNKS